MAESLSRRSSILLLLFLFSALEISQEQALQDPATDPAESSAVFDVLQGINGEIDWKGLFPGDPCVGGPHGLVCDVDSSNVYHVVELNLGWVSDYVNNPPCSANATIHSSIFRFRSLRKLFFYRCFVHSPVTIPGEIHKLSASLQHLTFQNNPSLVGSIPEGMSNLTSLERLVLTENSLSGSIPEGIASLANLKQLVLSHNRLTGRIPAALGALRSLIILDLSSNQLAGGIPVETYSLPELQKLDLSHNLLQGSIPDEVRSLQVLNFLDLSFNNLSGQLPARLGELGSLQYLFLGSNLIGSELPNMWEGLRNLVAVGLSNSRYDGVIPDSIGALQKLNSLSLDGNQFSGRIPETIGKLPNVYHINLGGNSLVGPVPFDESLIGRLGRNLIVRNNSGLCYEKLPMERGSQNTLGLEPCSSQALNQDGSPAGFFKAVPGSGALTWSLRVEFIVLTLVVMLLYAMQSL